MISGFYVTTKGQNYITRAMTDRALVFTKGEFGNGIFPADGNPLAVTALVNKLGPLTISRKKAEGNNVIVTTQFTNKVNGSILPAFKLTEVALYGKLQTYAGANDPEGAEALLFYGYTTADKADYIDAILTEFMLNFPLTTSSAATIEAVIDDSMVYPTLEEFRAAAGEKITADGTGAALTGISDQTVSDGVKITVKLPAGIQAGATFAVNGGTAYPIKTIDGNPVKAGPKAGSYIDLIYSASGQCWYMMGGGGGAEMATESEAMAGTNTEKAMSPATTKKVVDKALGDVGTILDTINGETI